MRMHGGWVCMVGYVVKKGVKANFFSVIRIVDTNSLVKYWQLLDHRIEHTLTQEDLHHVTFCIIYLYIFSNL